MISIIRKQAWIDAGYKEFIAEDFHFAYRIYKIEETGELVAWKRDPTSDGSEPNNS